MAQYREGTINLGFGALSVTGTGTRFLSNVRTGDMLLVDAAGPAAFVASVLSDTELLLEQPWPGGGAIDGAYAIHRDFDPTTGAPLLAQGDTALPLVFNRAVGLLSAQTAMAVAGSEAVTAALAARDAAQVAASAAVTDAGATASDRTAISADRTVVIAAAAAVATDRQAALTARDAAIAGAATTSADRASVAADKAAMATALSQAQALVGAAGTGTATGLAYGAVSKQIFNDSTMVVHVYDTSRDTDGGAWTERCQGASWYREALNSATRGATRRFPRVALIVAANRQLLIYDAHDLDSNGVPRLWMQFSGTAAVPIYDSASEASALHALNGRIYLAVRGTTWSGLITIDFPADRVTARDATALTQRNSNIAARNVAGTARVITTAATARLVSGTVHDVNAKVLPGAPLDAAGLPIPTVAAATAAGLSVIHPWGIVYDVADANGYQRIQFAGSDRLMATLGANLSIMDVGPIPYADFATSSAWRLGRYGGPTTGSVLKFPIEAPVQSLAQGAFGSNKGLRLLAENKDNPSAGMVAHVATTWATGWQPGDIRGGWLSDADAGNISASGELVTNGDFAGGATGWNSVSCTVSGASGALRVSTTNPFGTASQGLATVVGQTYLLSVAVMAVSGGTPFACVGTTVGGSDIVGVTILAVGTSGLLQFTAIGTTTHVCFGNLAAGVTVDIDNVSVRLALPDRSCRGKGLLVNGTVSRTALPCGLAAWSGFGSANYLEQPNNADLDFAEDFAVIGWINTTDTYGTIFERAHHMAGAYTASPAFRIELAAGGVSIRTSSDGFATSQVLHGYLSATVNDGQWHQFVAARRGESFEISVDGALLSRVYTPVSNLGNASAASRIGVSFGGTGEFTPGALALLRVTATVPTAAQARRMYRDERAIMVEGLSAMLGGTSNYVRSLSANEERGSLAVATDDGFSIFAGLARTAYLNSGNTSGAIADYPLRSISAAGAYTLAATQANAGFFSDPVIARDLLVSPGQQRAPAELPQVFEVGTATTDATPTDLSPRIYVGEQESVVIEATIHARGHDTGSHGGLYKRLARYTRDSGGNLTVAGTMQTIGIDQETSAGMDATLVIDTAAQTVTPRVTGIAGTRMVWIARIIVTRISKEGSNAAA
ncbi:LamG-like jellyroll fold domain-containing protein [Niveispirillum sp. KHB5.9]|uniref:LamG-like jellyroll fold domain-containing protein n=1 Tax=Niveispirillum sp. KHB5.9 TaxID=3400269 RepID=UPI003A89DEB3